MIDLPLLSEELKRDEGFRERVYLCSAGKQSIGHGHNLEDSPMPKVIAEKLLNHDIATALAQCESFDWFYTLNDVRKRVIINMVFNLGVGGVSKFKKMIEAIKMGDYLAAGNEMIDSKWFDQVGDRAVRLSDLMTNG
jgi:lysozyme